MKFASVCCACGLFSGAAGTVSAGEPGRFSGAVALSSEQVLRGVRQGGGGGSLSVDLNHRFDDNFAWVAGVGLATLGRDDRGLRTVVNASIAHGFRLDDDWSAQAAAARYAYPGTAVPRAFDYDELSITLGWRGRLGAAVTFSPDTARRNADGSRTRGRATAWELSARQPLGGAWTLDAGAGWRDLQGRGYPYASVAVGWTAGPWQIVGSVIGSRAAERGLAPAGAAGRRGVASLVRDF